MHKPYTAHLRKKPEKIPLIIYVAMAYVLASPFYIFPSGMPQPADMFIALSIVIYAAHTLLKNAKISLPKTYAIAGAFATYTFIINFIHFVFIKDMTFFLSSLYYIYNVLIFVLFSSIIKKYQDQAVNWIYIATAFAIILQVALLIIDPSYRGPRATGTFMNPNQLAYWSWYCAAILVALKINRGIKLHDVALLFCIGYIQTMSLSKAGIICFLLILLTVPFSSALPRKYKVFLILSATFVTIFAIFSLPAMLEKIQQYERIDVAVNRLNNIGKEGDDSAHGRGYTRVIENPHYMIMGSGEGGYFRFGDISKNLELHSGVGTLIFCYGIIGTGLFFLLLFNVQKRNYSYIIILFSLVLLYGVVHQNIRFTHFWVFLGICEGMRYSIKPRTKQSLPEDTQSTTGLSTT